MGGISPYIIAIAVALVTAQLLKYLVLAVRKQKFDRVRQLYSSGNIPSAHSASVTALLVVVGLIDGTESGLFAIALLFAVVVMYDAVMVRRSVGEQGKALHLLIRTLDKKGVLPRAALGHTPLELAAGAVLGGVIGVVVFFATI